MIDCCVLQATHLDHVGPVLRALDPAERGVLYLPDAAMADVSVDWMEVRHEMPDRRIRRPTLCAQWGAAQYCKPNATGRGVGRPIVLMEHGQGNHYGDGALSVGYVGGLGREGVVTFLDPNDHARSLHADRYPQVPGEVIGQPMLDAFTAGPRDTGIVVFAGHWHNQANNPAQHSAYGHYWDGMRAVVDELRVDGWEVRGSGHPRGRTKPPGFAHQWERLGVEPMWDFAQVLREAEVLVADNTSAQCLSAALGVRQVLLDCPWYAKARERRLWPRWAMDLGVEVSCAEQIPGAVRRSYIPDVSEVVPWVGGAGARAAEAIRRWVL